MPILKKRKSATQQPSSEAAKPEPELQKPPSPDEPEPEFEKDNSTSESEVDDDSKRESIKELLQPFGKDQLIEILKEAAATDPSITAQIAASAESDPIHRKLFVYGLGFDATKETLISVFNQYGIVEECNVVTDKTTGRCKGYGFVLFKKASATRKALKEPQKKIGNRMTTCQLAASGPVQQQQQQQQPRSEVSGRKLYIANVGPQISIDKLKRYFSQFGEIEDGPLGMDKGTGKFRGYAIVVYKSLEGIRKALEEPIKVFDGLTLQCSVATVKNNHNYNYNNDNSVNSHEVSAAGVSANAAAAAFLPGAGVIPGLSAGLSQGLVGQNLNPTGSVLFGQNSGLEILNPMLGVGARGMLNQMGLSASMAGALSQPLGRVGNAEVANIGYGGGVTMQPSVNSVSPSVMSSYGSQAALQGLSAYQNAQMYQSSESITKSQASIVSKSQYFGR